MFQWRKGGLVFAFLKRRRFWLELVIWVLLIAGVYGFTQWRGSRADEVLPRQLPALNVTSLSGQNAEIFQQPQKIHLLNFWAPNCPACLAETPILVRLQRWFGGKHFGIVGVAVAGSSARAVHARMQELGINYPVYLAAGQGAAAVGGVILTPTSLLVNNKGQIVGRYVGAIALPVILWKLFWLWV